LARLSTLTVEFGCLGLFMARATPTSRCASCEARLEIKRMLTAARTALSTAYMDTPLSLSEDSSNVTSWASVYSPHGLGDDTVAIRNPKGKDDTITAPVASLSTVFQADPVD
jgi:hypothetical protein